MTRKTLIESAQIGDLRHNLSEWDMQSIGTTKLAWKPYNEVIASYTKRKLTYESDYVFAISGILKASVATVVMPSYMESR
jgi:hypothetical protein